MIGFRVDANNEIGMGHAMRCMTIAQALQGLGEGVIFICCKDTLPEVFASRGFGCYRIDRLYSDKTNEMQMLKQVMDKYEIDKLVVDSYAVDEDYFRNIKEAICKPIIYIDDLHRADYAIDMLINYNIFADKLAYNLGNNILGLKNVPIRTEMLQYQPKASFEGRNVVLTIGATDNQDLAYRLVQRLACSDYILNVIVGKYFKAVDKLLELAGEKVIMYTEVKDMGAILSNMDYAVSAAGVTLYELAYLGIPTVCFAVADNQRLAVEGFGEKEMALAAGEAEEINIELIVEKLQLIMSDRELFDKLKANMLKAVDGMGALRLARKIKML